MAEVDLANQFEFGHYTNPATGKTRLIIRKSHDITRSPRLANFRECMHNVLEGRHYQGHGAKEDELMVRQAFRQAVHQCAKEDR